MQHVQGSSGSHWTLPLGNYLLRIALAAAMETINKTTMQNLPSLLAFLMAIAMRRYYTARITRWWRLLAFIIATNDTIGQALAPILPIGHAPTPDFRGILFHCEIVEKELELP